MSPTGASWEKSMAMGAHSADPFRGDQADAHAAMRAAGVKGPRPCRCENPATYRNEDGERRCLCGSAVAP